MSESVLMQDGLNDEQVKLRYRLGYMPMVAKRDTMREAMEDATKIAEASENTSGTMTAMFLLYNTLVHKMAEKCIPLGAKNMSKGDIVKLLYGSTHTEEQTIDFARPYSWDVEMRANGTNPDWYVWVYKKGGMSGGEPLNLAEAMLEKIMS